MFDSEIEEKRLLYGDVRLIAHERYRKVILAADEEGDASRKHVWRTLALNDLFFILVYVLNVKVADNDWAYKQCKMFEKDRDGYLDIWPREHFKSTIITLGASIQEAMRDPNISICIFSYNKAIARAFLNNIKGHLERNELLRELFDDVIWANPQSDSPKWSEHDGLVLCRTEELKEATFEAWGLVDGQPTSRHYKLMIYDDTVVPSSVTSSDMINKTTEAMALSFNLGSEFGNRRWMLGTRYHFADTYHVMMDRGACKPRVFAATVDGKKDGAPWLLSRARLAEKIRDMGSYVSSCQLFSNPVMEGEEVFRPEWIRTWVPTRLSNANYYILVDPANEKGKKSDYTVMCVFAASQDSNYYLVDMIRDKLSLSERCARLFELYRTYKPLGVGYEKYGMQSDIQHIKERQIAENLVFRIEELGGNMAKNDRIKRLQPLFEAGRIYIPTSLYKKCYDGRTVNVIEAFLNDEYYQFPFMQHDDMLDCMARITDEDMQIRFPRIITLDSLDERRDYDNARYEIDTFAILG